MKKLEKLRQQPTRLQRQREVLALLLGEAQTALRYGNAQRQADRTNTLRTDSDYVKQGQNACGQNAVKIDRTAKKLD